MDNTPEASVLESIPASERPDTPNNAAPSFDAPIAQTVAAPRVYDPLSFLNETDSQKKPQAAKKKHSDTAEEEDESEKKDQTDDEGDPEGDEDPLPEDPDDTEESDDDDDDDDDDEGSPSGASGEEDENQLVQIKKKEETALKNPFLTPQKIAEKKPVKEQPKGPEKTERSPWQQVWDFLVHGAKGAMIKNGDISIKERITDKLLIGLGFKSFKEDVLLQKQAKKYWSQKNQGLKADTSLLNTDKITERLRKEEKQELKPLKEAALKEEQKRFERFGKPIPAKMPENGLKIPKNFFSKLPFENTVLSPDLSLTPSASKSAPLQQEIPQPSITNNLKSKIGVSVQQPIETTKTDQKTSQESQNRQDALKTVTAALENQKNLLTENKIYQKQENEEKTVSLKQKEEKQTYENAFIIQQMQMQASMQNKAAQSQNILREELALIQSMRANAFPPAHPHAPFNNAFRENHHPIKTPSVQATLPEKQQDRNFSLTDPTTTQSILSQAWVIQNNNHQQQLNQNASPKEITNIPSSEVAEPRRQQLHTMTNAIEMNAQAAPTEQPQDISQIHTHKFIHNN